MGFTSIENFPMDNYKDIVLIDNFENYYGYRSGMYLGKIYKHLI